MTYIIGNDTDKELALRIVRKLPESKKRELENLNLGLDSPDDVLSAQTLMFMQQCYKEYRVERTLEYAFNVRVHRKSTPFTKGGDVLMLSDRMRKNLWILLYQLDKGSNS